MQRTHIVYANLGELADWVRSIFPAPKTGVLQVHPLELAGTQAELTEEERERIMVVSYDREITRVSRELCQAYNAERKD